MIRLELIRSLLNKMARSVQLLDRYRTLSYAEFTSDDERVYAAERALEVCIQVVIDVSAHLVSELQLAMPNENRELPVALGKVGVIPKDFAVDLASMIGMRNIIVHEYLGVDVSRVYDAIQRDLGDFDEFAQHIVAYLKKEGLA